MPESSLQSENITYRPHAARGCVKLQSKHIRNTYDRYITTIIIIYENCTVRLASVGLAQARPNNNQRVGRLCRDGADAQYIQYLSKAV